MRVSTRIKAAGVIAAAVVGSLLAMPQAQAAAPGDYIFGHRCRVYDRAVNNENTVLALREISQSLPGASCEIDAVKIADGTVIVWHDGTWNRVANPNTLPSGVSPSSKVLNATWAQVRQIRTRGGQPVARLQDMIDAAAQYNVKLVVDIRNSLPNPQGLVDYATQRGADVSYYQLVKRSCNTPNIDKFRAAGAKVGVKLLGECNLTPAQIAAKGATFTQQISFSLTDAYLADMDSRGIAVGVLDRGMTETKAEQLRARGVDRFLLDNPAVAADWFN